MSQSTAGPIDCIGSLTDYSDLTPFHLCPGMQVRIAITLSDWKYVWKNESDSFTRAALLCQVPSINCVLAYAQYRGARDNTASRTKED